MQRFFTDFDELERFTLSLDYHAKQLRCPHCDRCGQLVSHGVVYKQRSMTRREVVGKRLFCSGRHQRRGCGRTFPLYVASTLPRLRYGAAQLFIFLSRLLAGMAVVQAYQQATGQTDARHAWRWLNTLNARLSDFRCALPARPALMTVARRSRRLQLLLGTLGSLFARLGRPVRDALCPCARYQQLRQTPFLPTLR